MTIGKECSKVGRAQMEKSLYLDHVLYCIMKNTERLTSGFNFQARKGN